MDVLQGIISTFRHTIPANSETAKAIDHGESVEAICACATSEGLHDFASALFAADVEEVQNDGGPIDADETLLENIEKVLAEYEHRLPPNCETARLIKAGAQLELISQAAEAEGLQDLVAILFEAEQEQIQANPKPATSK